MSYALVLEESPWGWLEEFEEGDIWPKDEQDFSRQRETSVGGRG